jgi:hypothetical protein
VPKQFVFVAGHSATGKKTFIEKVMSDAGSELRERFRLHGSLDSYGADFKQVAGAIESTADTVLIKWQFADHHWVEELKKRKPSCEHRVILLWKPKEVHHADLMKKQQVWKPTPAALERDWYDLIVPLFGDIHLKGIRCELVNGRTYEPLPDWP